MDNFYAYGIIIFDRFSVAYGGIESVVFEFSFFELLTSTDFFHLF